MLGRLQSSLLHRYSLQCLESRFHTACSLTQAAADGPPADSNPQQKSRQASGGGPNRQRKNPARDGPGSDRGLQRPSYGPRGSDGGPNRGGGSYRQQQQRGGGGGGGQRNTNYQGGPRRPHQGGGGGGNQNILEAALGPQQSGPPKTGAEAIMQYLTPTAINTDLLPIADYILKPQVAPPRPSRFQQRDGRGGGNYNAGPNPRVQAAKLRNVLLRTPSKVSRVIQKQMELDTDPNYRIEDVFGSSSAISGSADRSPEETLDSFKNELVSMLGISEDEFESYKQQAVAVFKEETLPMLEQEDPRVKEQELEKLLENITQEHEYYESIVAKFRVLQSNPDWSHEKKVVFAKRLLKRFS